MKKQTIITYSLLGSAIIFFILHNVIYAIFKFEEPVFFILCLLAAFGFFISVIYNIITYIKNKFKRKK